MVCRIVLGEGFFFFQAEDGIRDLIVTGVQTCALPIYAFWQFYQDTGARKWGTPYLTRQFFDIVQENMREDVILVLAERGGIPIAGALNFIGRKALFGRYWGCSEDHACLHFELCYYRAIELAIERGFERVEAGAQGQHKLARGYLPVNTHSLHWVGDKGFSDAIERYLIAEREAIEQDIEVLTDYGPFKKSHVEEHE